MIKCEVCGNDLYDWECEEACWWCEMDDGQTNVIEMTTLDDWCT